MTSIEWPCRYGVLRGLQWGDKSLPKVLALHGWLDNAASFSRLAPLLQNVCVLAPDLPGHGHSDWLGEGADYAIWSSLEPLYDLLQTLNEPVHLLGHSMGSAVGMLLAGAFPDKIASYVALDALGPLTTPPAQAPEQLAKAIMAPLKTAALKVHAGPEEALAARVRQNPELSPECIWPVVERNLQSLEGGVGWRTDGRLRAISKVRLSEAQIEAFMAAMNMPALVLRAEQGLIPRAMFDLRIKHLPLATLEEFPGHHHLHLEESTVAALATRINRFWQEHS
ncbi:alpha/beta fold hydrolase [Thalassolituus hydrocarboniclasticus]|uniref:Alpha/beta fold hydrolase n=1 Tax=Thalassolituus hydrocarboniclasticus TaxID=2742796 RepID=A0ABY6AA45_9GAMM|nr:alpha/beta hydrolase [Thalassolituus hydrocarboniclasticus]UXD87570.1 alpha/beta fold hydrolase [Thalassolituus hydrocarboniclasticus]